VRPTAGVFAAMRRPHAEQPLDLDDASVEVRDGVDQMID
jgi:hypothetical protein